MASGGESSLIPSNNNNKPVIVRVKRKASQSCLDVFWLEIKERPLKRALIDLENLSLLDLSSKVEEPRSRKLLVQHVETVTTSEVTTDIVQSLVSESLDELESKGQKAETRRSFKTENRQQQLLAKARQSQEVASKNARFEQIWRSRRCTKEIVHSDAVVDMCQLYDIVRVDEGRSNCVQKDKIPEVDDDCKMMVNILPLLREVIPSAATEVEADILHRLNGASIDTYVYDYYAVKDNRGIIEESIESPFPLVQVHEEDEYCDGPDESEYESDDSNAENNPLNDYPDEELSDADSSCTDDRETESSSSKDDEEKDQSDDCVISDDKEEHHDWCRNLEEEYDEFFEFGEVDDDDDYDDGGDDRYEEYR